MKDQIGLGLLQDILIIVVKGEVKNMSRCRIRMIISLAGLLILLGGLYYYLYPYWDNKVIKFYYSNETVLDDFVALCNQDKILSINSVKIVAPTRSSFAIDNGFYIYSDDKLSTYTVEQLSEYLSLLKKYRVHDIWFGSDQSVIVGMGGMYSVALVYSKSENADDIKANNSYRYVKNLNNDWYFAK